MSSQAPKSFSKVSLPIFSIAIVSASLLLAGWQMPSGTPPSNASSQSKPATPASGAPQGQPPEKFKNLQVLDKNTTPEQLFPTMNMFATSLGVTCQFCHDRYDRAADTDNKKTARQMMTMTNNINQQFFGGHPAVSCNSCHRGANMPVSLPSPRQAAWFKAAHGEPVEDGSEPQLPGADALFAKYRQAIGVKAGEKEPSQEISMETTVHMPMSPAPATWKVEVVMSGDKALIATQQDNGSSEAVINGKDIWIKDAKGVRPAGEREVEAVRGRLIPYAVDQTVGLTARRVFRSNEKIAGKENYGVQCRDTAGKPAVLYFDVESGLLLRRRDFSDTLFGRVANDTEFGNYKPVAGYKLPGTIDSLTTSSGIERKVVERKVNVPVDSRKFEKPS